MGLNLIEVYEKSLSHFLIQVPWDDKVGTPGLHRAVGGREAEGAHFGRRAVPAVRHHPRHQVPQAQLRRRRSRHRRPVHPETLSGED